MGKFEDIKIGDVAEIVHVITDEDIKLFIELTGDDNKIHVDKAYASKTSFKKPVVHGMLGASFISTLIGTKLPGDGALWFSQNLEFLLPARIGDTIKVVAQVLSKNEKSQIIELSTDIFNQNKQKITKGTAKVKVIEPVSDKINGTTNCLKPKVALVIGGTGGIGEKTCIQLAKDGFDIAIHYNNNSEKAKEMQKIIEELGQNSIIVKSDITDNESIKLMIESVIRKFGTITVLANCAGMSVPNIKFYDLSWENFQNQFDLNIKGLFNLLKIILPIMEINKYGKIINISTIGVEKPFSELSHYITAKSALAGFTKSLANDFAPKGIRINLVSPGITDTDLNANLPEKVKLITASQTPLRRIALAEDIANAISFLASERSDFITGETIRVNGGMVMI
ncbi:MAG: SDR family oxidoreductase [bacterium]